MDRHWWMFAQPLSRIHRGNGLAVSLRQSRTARDTGDGPRFLRSLRSSLASDRRTRCLRQRICGRFASRQSAVLGRCGGDEDVGVAEGLAAFASRLDHVAPLKEDVLRDGQYPAIERRTQPLVEPVMQLGPSLGIADQLDSESNRGEGHLAEARLGLTLLSHSDDIRGVRGTRAVCHPRHQPPLG